MAHKDVDISLAKEKEYNTMLESLINTMPGGVGIFVFAPKMECEYFSDGLSKMAGLTRAEFEERMEAGTILSSIIAPDDYSRVLKIFEDRTSKGLSLNLDYRYLHSDGSTRWVHFSAVKLRETKGYPVYYCIFTTPPDEEVLYRSIVEDSAIGVLVAERESRNVLYMNSTAKKFYGFTTKEEIPFSFKNYIEQYGSRLLLNKEQVASLQHDVFSNFHVKKNSTHFLIKAKALEWKNTDSYIIYISDETKEMEDKQQLEALVNKVPGGIGIYDIEGEKAKLVYLNDEFYNMVGVKEKERGKFFKKGLLEQLHPEDRASALEKIKKLRSGDEHSSSVYRLQVKENKWLYVRIESAVAERTADHIRCYVTFLNCDDIVKAQQAMEEARKKEETLMAGIPGGVAIYRIKKDGTVSTDFISEGLARLCGYEDKEECLEYLRENALVNVAEEDRKKLLEAVKKNVETHQPLSIVYYIHVKDKPDILQRLDANLIESDNLPEDVLGIWYAVHTKVSKDSQEAMAEQARYRTIMNNLDLAFLEIEPGKSYYASPKYYSYALSDEDINAVSANTANADTVHPEDEPLRQAFLVEAKQNKKRIVAVMRLKMKDGSYKWTEILNFNDYDKKGNKIRSVGILRDVDKERIEQNEKLRNALLAAQNANHAKTAFLSRMSHDMRTPLNGILGLTSFMKECTTDNTIMDDLDDLEVSGKYLLNLINDTLDVSKIESGKLELKPQVCTAKELLQDIVKLAKPSAQTKHLEFKANLIEADNTLLYVDRSRFEQVLMNVLGNAIKFTPEGGTVEIQAEKLAKTNGVLTEKIIVRDTGIGMSKEFLPHIFEAFSQEDNSLTTIRQGTGLGMAIAKQLIELLNGTISAESELGKGTTFNIVIDFPLATKEQIKKYEETKIHLDRNVDFTGKHFLLCEDHPLNAKISTKLLQAKGAIVEWAENGQVGVDKFAASPMGYYDAILMDIRMPVLDGITAVAHIRKMERKDATSIPIVAMTANAFDDDVEETKAVGMDAHVSKPIDKAMLYSILSEQIKASKD